VCAERRAVAHGPPQTFPVAREKGGAVEFARNILKGALAAALMLAALSGWGENKGPIYLAHATKVAGSVLASGNYNLRWERTGGEVQVKIYQGKKEVANVPARVIQLSSPSPFDSAVVESKDGTQSLSEIRFEGKKFALRIAGDDSSGGSAVGSK
jgi:predicted small lipoprotein YifL